MGNKSIEKRQIFIIVSSVILIAIILVFLSYNFFIEYDMRGNRPIKPITEYKEFSKVDIQNERIYHIIFDDSDEMSVAVKDGIERVIKSIRVKYTVSNMDSIKKISGNDYVILTARNWYESKNTIDEILDSVSNGASLLIAGLPGYDQLFRSHSRKFGIYELGDDRMCEGIKVLDDVVLGLRKGDFLSTASTQDYIFDIHLVDEAKVYLTDEFDIALYYTIDYGQGKVGIYNGDNLYERYFGGITAGILGTLNDGLIYPIINSGVMFIDDWPGPFQGENVAIEQQYGMDIDDFLKLVWWPDMVSLSSKYGVKYTGQYVLTYNDIQKAPFDIGNDIFDIPMYSFGQQLLKNDGELGLHGYNHQPLKFSDYSDHEYDGVYAPWEEKDDAITALNYAVESLKEVFPGYDLVCYVPPSNIIDDQGIEAVKEVLGTPLVMSALYVGGDVHSPSHDFKVEDDVIYFPRLTAGSFLDDDIALSLACGMGQYGVVSHFIHPDDALDPVRSRGMEWEQMRLEYDKMMAYISERYPYIEYQTISEAANKTIDWNAIDYSVTYTTDYIKVKSLNISEKYGMILRSDKKVIEGQGYTFEPAGEHSYYIEILEPEVMIDLESEG